MILCFFPALKLLEVVSRAQRGRIGRLGQMGIQRKGKPLKGIGEGGVISGGGEKTKWVEWEMGWPLLRSEKWEGEERWGRTGSSGGQTCLI